MTTQIQITYELNVIPGKAAELREIAREKKIGQYSTLKKKELIKKLENLL